MTPRLQNWWERVTGSAKRPGARRPAARFRPELTALEDRTAPTVGTSLSYYVSLSGNDTTGNGLPGAPYRTIQHAINVAGAADNDTIFVQAGTYSAAGTDGPITIPSGVPFGSLKLSGGWNSNFTSQSAQGTVYVTQGTSSDDGIDVQAPNVTISNFQWVFDGTAGPGGSLALNAGIVSEAANLFVGSNLIEAPVQGYGVVTNGSAGLDGLVVAANTITAQGSDLAGGVYLNPGTATTRAILSGNTVTGNELYQGIIADTASNVIIENNQLSRVSMIVDAQGQPLIGVGPVNGGADQSNVTVTGNTVDSGHTPHSVGIQVGSNSGNLISLTNVTFNAATNNTDGILAENVTTATTHLNYNQLGGNLEVGVEYVAGAGTLDATLNFWGDPTGPLAASNPNGMGDAVAGAVNFRPWATNAFASTFSNLTPVQIDFGTATSPVAAGYVRATDQTAYSAVQGYGWKAGSSIFSFDRGVGTDLTRDFNYTTSSADFLVDVPNGVYSVTLQLGDTQFAHGTSIVSFQGSAVDTVSNSAGQIITKTYVVKVANGQLDLGLQAISGPNQAAVIEGLEIMPAQYDFGTATSPVAAGFVGVTDQTAYSTATGYGWQGGSNVASADRGTSDSLTRDFNYTTTNATFAVDLANGTYTVTLQLGDTGPFAHGTSTISFQGSPVDTVSNVAGQILSKTYVVTVTNGQLDLGLTAGSGPNPAAVLEGLEIVPGPTPPPPPQFDFGTPTSPVASGFVGVSDENFYTTASGYGWKAGSDVQSADRANASDLTRDFNYTTTHADFLVDLPNGTYSVTLQLGDTGVAHGSSTISFQGSAVDTVSNVAGQIITRTYAVTVTNGQLDLGLTAVGGPNPAAVLEGMEIVAGSPPSQYDFGTATSPLAGRYQLVTEATAYSAATHFGWKAGSNVASFDRGNGTDLTRDFNYTTTSADFLVDLANGTYTVTLQLGDTGVAHGPGAISFQGTQVDTVSNVAGQIITKTYVVTVANGQLDLGLTALSGPNQAVVLEGMEIVLV
jgi:fibronectin type 3 domain-containing protein